MKDCIAADAIKVTSSLPDFARDAHGNLAEQNRLVGAQLGANTHQPPAESLAAQVALRASASANTATPAAAAAGDKAGGDKSASPVSGAAQQTDARAVTALLQANACTACHAVDNKVIGPSYADVSKKYRDQADAVSYLAAKIKSGGVGVWGPIPMPAQALPPADAKVIAEWLVQGAAKP